MEVFRNVNVKIRVMSPVKLPVEDPDFFSLIKKNSEKIKSKLLNR